MLLKTDNLKLKQMAGSASAAWSCSGMERNGYFTGKLAIWLSKSAFTSEQMEGQRNISLQNSRITKSQLVLNAKVSGTSKKKFDDRTIAAKANCPVSKVVNTNIIIETGLLQFFATYS